MRYLLILTIWCVIAGAQIEAKVKTKSPQKSSQQCGHCERGPRGYPGKPGPRGPTGPALASSYASFYASTPLFQTLNNTDSLLLQFDTPYYPYVGITPSSSIPVTFASETYDTFEVSKAGIYLITWSFKIAPSVSVNSTAKQVAVTLYMNDTPLAPTSMQACVTTPWGQTTPIALTTTLSGSMSIPLSPTDKIKLEVVGIGGGTTEEVATLSSAILTITQIGS